MNESDIAAWERELNHAAKMQDQLKGSKIETVTFSGGKTYEIKDDGNDK